MSQEFCLYDDRVNSALVEETFDATESAIVIVHSIERNTNSGKMAASNQRPHFQFFRLDNVRNLDIRF